MRIVSGGIAALFAAVVFLVPVAANATFVDDTTQNVSYQGSNPVNWFAGGTSNTGDVIEGPPEFDTHAYQVTQGVNSLEIDFLTQFGGDALGAHYADIFLATDPGHPDNYNFAIALGGQVGHGGVAAGIYAITNNFQTSIQRWQGTGYIYGGKYVSPNDNTNHDAPTVVTSGTALAGWTVDVSSSPSGDPTFPILLAITITAIDNQIMQDMFADPTFSFLWGTGDCNNDSVYATDIDIPDSPPIQDQVPEPPAALLLASGLLLAGMFRFRKPGRVAGV